MDYLGLYSAIQCGAILDYKYNLGTPKVYGNIEGYIELLVSCGVVWGYIGGMSLQGPCMDADLATRPNSLTQLSKL